MTLKTWQIVFKSSMSYFFSVLVFGQNTVKLGSNKIDLILSIFFKYSRENMPVIVEHLK